MVEWKSASFQIILPLLTSGLAISAFNSFYNDAYNKPNIQVDVSVNEIDERISSIEVSNIGRVPADNVLITIRVPEIHDYEIINTENITVVDSAGDPRLLQLYAPRLVNGEGSFIRVVIITSNKIMNHDEFSVYVTFDQGSVKVGGVKKVSTFEDKIVEFFSIYGSFIFFIVFVIITVISLGKSYIVGRRRTGRISSLTKYMKVIDSIYETLKLNKEECFTQLNEIQREITQLFIKGKLNEAKYTILVNKIAINISRL